jgi:hypothetical protein
MNFYRYETVEYASIGWDGEYTRSKYPNPKLELRTFDLISETLKGYWIGYSGLRPLKFKWISKTSKKRYAYPTKEEALNGYISRTKRRLDILNYQLSSCKIGIDLAEMEKKKVLT